MICSLFPPEKGAFCFTNFNTHGENREIVCAFHDIDGTHSLIREWPPVMSICLYDVIVNGLPEDFDSKENEKRLIEICGTKALPETDKFCVESAGLSALTQMEWAIRRAVEEKTVAVIGGGNTAAADTTILSRIAKKVYVIHRRDTFRAAHSLVEKARHMDNIEFIIDTTVSEICGEDMVEKLMLTNVKTKEKTQLEVNGIFIAVGIVPDTDILQGVVEMDEKGYVLADELGNTNIPGIFVAGDCKKKKLRQIITAVADGANAVTGVEEYFNS